MIDFVKEKEYVIALLKRIWGISGAKTKEAIEKTSSTSILNQLLFHLRFYCTGCFLRVSEDLFEVLLQALLSRCIVHLHHIAKI